MTDNEKLLDHEQCDELRRFCLHQGVGHIVTSKQLDQWLAIAEDHLIGDMHAGVLYDCERLQELRQLRQLDSDEAIGRLHRVACTALNAVMLGESSRLSKVEVHEGRS